MKVRKMRNSKNKKKSIFFLEQMSNNMEIHAKPRVDINTVKCSKLN